MHGCELDAVRPIRDAHLEGLVFHCGGQIRAGSARVDELKCSIRGDIDEFQILAINAPG